MRILKGSIVDIDSNAMNWIAKSSPLAHKYFDAVTFVWVSSRNVHRSLRSGFCQFPVWHVESTQMGISNDIDAAFEKTSENLTEIPRFYNSSKYIFTMDFI